MTKTIRVIGIGSPVMGDTLGLQLVERLQQDGQWQRHDEIEWLLLERPGAALLHYFEKVEMVCLVDAVMGEGASNIGVISLSPEDLVSEEFSLSSHHFGVAEALQLASTLGQLPPRLLILGVTDGPLDERYAELSRLLQQNLGTSTSD